MAGNETSRRVHVGAATVGVLAGLLSGANGAWAADDAPAVSAVTAAAPESDLERMRALVDTATKRMDEQDRRLAEQEHLIEQLRQELDAVHAGLSPAESAQDLSAIRAGALGNTAGASVPAPAPTLSVTPPVTVAQTAPPTAAAASGSALPDQPVGEAPDTADKAAEVVALPEGAGVLTPPGAFIVESSIEYDRSSSNRLVFRGVEIVPGIQLGLVDANDVARDTVVGAADLRVGVTNRLELSARIPAIYRHDVLTTLSQQVSPGVPGAMMTSDLEGRDLGDIELGGRYQLNSGLNNNPIFVSSLRVKTPTGNGPFDVGFDTNGVATELATGSGFWAVQPGITMLFPSDPAVIFASLGYLHNFGRDIDKDIGTTHVGNVDPGDAISAGLGFGLALNQQFSFSLGYSHSVILATKTELGSTTQKSSTLQVGSLTMGWSYTFSPGFSISNNFEFGVTNDAPDLRVVFRTPFRF